mgnify:CR=1 FL=1
MPYKTIALELIREITPLYEQLRSTKRLLPAMDAYAIELKTAHIAWQDTLAQIRPGSDLRQISSEAMELAVDQLRQTLLALTPLASSKGGAEPTAASV